MSSVFAVTSNMSINALRDLELFATLDLAKQKLKSLADERRNKVGVSVIEDDGTTFSYLFGWEERQVIFSVIELGVKDV